MSLRRKFVIPFCLIALTASLCLVSTDMAPAESELQSEFDQDLLENASNEFISQFARKLMKELIGTIDSAGTVAALSVCQQAAPRIAESHSNFGWQISRVSDKNRNPDNRADSVQMLLLRAFGDTASSKSDYFVQWSQQDSSIAFEYYKPIRVNNFCLKCHGGEGDIDDDVRTAVSKLYPEDKATGYSSGDLRGMFVVTVRLPEGLDYAEKLVAGDTIR